MSFENESYVPRRSRRTPQQTQHTKTPTQQKRGGFFKKVFLSLVALLFVGCAVGAVTAAVLYTKWSETLPSDEEILSYQANRTSFIYDRNGKVITELYIERRKPVTLDQLSPYVTMSILAAEDDKFFKHHGIRPLAILRSFLTGSGGQGASTLTQQLARNLFLTQEKSLTRKGKEAILSLRLEKLFTKEQLLQMYVNAIYLGHGVYGVSEAADAYFSTTPDKLTLGQSTLLAGLIAAPERYSPIKDMQKARRRQNYVLSRLVSLGWVTEEQAEAARNEEIKLSPETAKKSAGLSKDSAPYFVSHILFNYLLPTYGTDRVYKGGLEIYTTLDLDLQRAAEAAISNLKSEGALVAMDPSTGAVLAMVGGKDFDASKFNRATQAYRPAGSSFKPFVYASAMEQGYLPNDHILDAPIQIKVRDGRGTVWKPRNFSNKFVGEETLFMALAKSHNTPAVRLTQLVGIDNIINIARRMGITSPHLTPAMSIGLGVSSVTPLEMARAFSVFANNGLNVEPMFITSIKTSTGQTLMSATPKVKRAIEPDVAQITRGMLQVVMTNGTGGGGRIPNHVAFGKTGTTNDYSDAWFAGGIPGLVAVVYAGNDDYSSLGRNATGGRIALPVWKAFMTEAVKAYPAGKNFPRPTAGLKAVTLCAETGFLPGPSSSSKVTLIMPTSRIPTTQCPLHGGSMLTASTDLNAPKLLKVANDVSDTTSPLWETITDSTAPVLDNLSSPTTPIAPAEVEKPKRTDPKDIDKRFEELLREYKIKL